MGTILQSILDFLISVLNSITSFLPDSPFLGAFNLTLSNDIMGAINYFVPVAECIAIAQAWLVAIGIFYIYQVTLRWTKAIE